MTATLASHVLVVAHYRENVDWTETVPDPWEPLVITKEVHLPNEGREVSTFLWAMTLEHVREAERVAFVQGSPLVHDAGLWMHLGLPTVPFRWLGRTDWSCEADGSPHHPGLDLAGFLKCWTRRRLVPPVWFAPGGQFDVSGETVRAQKAERLDELYREVCTNPDGPWLMERLWPSILGVSP